jgi:hypothetical protein
VFARIVRRTVRISDPSAKTRLPSRVDANQLLFLVFAAEWILLAVFVFAQRFPGELHEFITVASLACAGAIVILYGRCVIRLQRLGVLYPRRYEPPRPRGGRKRAGAAKRHRATD